MSRGILVCCQNRTVVGGVETYLAATLPALERLGVQLGILFGSGGDCRRQQVDGGLTSARIHVATEGGPDLVRRFVEDFDPGFVVDHGLDLPGAGHAVLDGRNSTFVAHGYAGLCISGSRRWAFPRPRVCQRPFNAGCLVHYMPHRCGGWNPWTAVRLFHTGLRTLARLSRFDRVLVHSRWMQEVVANGGIPAGKVGRLSFPGLVRRGPEEVLGRRPTSTILFLGRLTPLKGGVLLVRATAHASRTLGRRLRIVVAGEGSESGGMRSEAVRLGLEVEFRGWVEGEARETLFREADVLAMPSLWPEPFGLAGPEAGAWGVPAVAFGVGGIGEWLKDGANGVLARGGALTAESFAEALCRAIAQEESWRRLCRGAWERASRESAEDYCRSFLAVIGAGPGADGVPA